MVTGNVVAGAFGFGLALVGLCYMIGPISGCHVNLAVSLAMLVNRRMGAKTMFSYMVAQILGAVFGAALLFGIMEIASLEVIGTMWGSNTYHEIAGIHQEGINGVLAALFIEISLTFVFVLTIMFVTALMHGRLIRELPKRFPNQPPRLLHPNPYRQGSALGRKDQNGTLCQYVN